MSKLRSEEQRARAIKAFYKRPNDDFILYGDGDQIRRVVEGEDEERAQWKRKSPIKVKSWTEERKKKCSKNAKTFFCLARYVLGTTQRSRAQHNYNYHVNGPAKVRRREKTVEEMFVIKSPSFLVFYLHSEFWVSFSSIHFVWGFHSLLGFYFLFLSVGMLSRCWDFFRAFAKGLILIFIFSQVPNIRLQTLIRAISLRCAETIAHVNLLMLCLAPA